MSPEAFLSARDKRKAYVYLLEAKNGKKLDASFYSLVDKAQATYFDGALKEMQGNADSGHWERAFSGFDGLVKEMAAFPAFIARVNEAKAKCFDRLYSDAASAFADGKLDVARARFELLGSFKDSQAKLEEVRAAIVERQRKANYEGAKVLMQGLGSENIDKAKVILEALGDYADAKRLLEYCKKLKDEWTDVERRGPLEFPELIAAAKSDQASLKDKLIRLAGEFKGLAKVEGTNSLALNIKHLESTWTYDVHLVVRSDQESRARALRMGEKVAYEAVFDMKDSSDYIWLKDAVILSGDGSLPEGVLSKIQAVAKAKAEEKERKAKEEAAQAEAAKREAAAKIRRFLAGRVLGVELAAGGPVQSFLVGFDRDGKATNATYQSILRGDERRITRDEIEGNRLTVQFVKGRTKLELKLDLNVDKDPISFSSGAFWVIEPSDWIGSHYDVEGIQYTTR